MVEGIAAISWIVVLLVSAGAFKSGFMVLLVALALPPLASGILFFTCRRRLEQTEKGEGN